MHHHGAYVIITSDAPPWGCIVREGGQTKSICFNPTFGLPLFFGVLWRVEVLEAVVFRAARGRDRVVVACKEPFNNVSGGQFAKLRLPILPL